MITDITINNKNMDKKNKIKFIIYYIKNKMNRIQIIYIRKIYNFKVDIERYKSKKNKIIDIKKIGIEVF